MSYSKVMLALLLLLQEPNLDQAISLEESAQSVGSFFHKVSERVGFEVSAAGSLKKNTLVVRFDEAPLRTVLDRVADALAAKWHVVDKKKVELYRTEEQTKALRTKEVADRKEAIQNSISEIDVPVLTEEMAQKIGARAQALEPRLPLIGKDPKVLKDKRALDGDMPAGRGAGKAALLIPPEMYLSLKPGERAVFSNRPNRLQKALPSGKKLVEEYNVERDFLRRAMADALMRESEMRLSVDPRAGQFRIKSRAERVIVALQRMPDLRGYMVSANFVDSEGWILGTGWRSINDSVPVAQPILEKVTLDLAKPFIDLNTFSFNSDVRSSVAATFCSPDRYDPHGWLPGELILDYARKTKRPLVAALSDLALRSVYLNSNPDVRPTYPSQMLAQYLARDWDTSVSEREGCLVIMPRMPLTAEREYLDRKLLQTALQAMLKEGRVSILEACKYAGSAESDLAGSFFEEVLVRATSPNGSDSPDNIAFQAEQFLLERLVGRIPDAFLANEVNEVKVSQLSAEAREVLTKWLMEGWLAGLFDDKVDSDHPYSNIAFREATEMFPEGIPDATTIRITWSTQPFIYAKWNQGVTLQPYKLVNNWADEPDGVDVDVVNGRCLSIEVKLPGGATVPADLWQAPPASNEARNWRKLSTLPGDVLAKMRTERARYSGLESTWGRYKPPPPGIDARVKVSAWAGTPRVY